MADPTNNRRIDELGLITSITDADIFHVIDRETDQDFGVSAGTLKGYMSPGGSGSFTGSLDTLTDVTVAPPVQNGAALRYDSAASQWTNVLSNADNLILQVSPTGSATPVSPLPPALGGNSNPFNTISAALAWVRARMRITTGLTLNIAAGTYNEPAAGGVVVGGDGYPVTLQGVSGAVIADTSTRPGLEAFLAIRGRVTLANLTITSKRWCVSTTYGTALTLQDCTLTNTDDGQALDCKDGPVRLAGGVNVNGGATFDGIITVGVNSTFTVTTAATPALDFRSNCDHIFGANARINMAGTGKTVQSAAAAGIQTASYIWLGNPVFTYRLPQPVKSDVTGLAGAQAVSNVVFISQAGYDAIPAKDPKTLYLIP